MTRFIKLTNLLLNTNFINFIKIEPNKYTIKIIDKSFSGDFWMLWGCGRGNILSVYNEVEVCKIKHSDDYKIVSDFINNYEKNEK